MSEQLWFTAILNKYLGPAVWAVMKALHVPQVYAYLGLEGPNPHAPINNFVAMECLVVAILVLLFLMVRARLSVETPGGLQHVFEGYYGFIDELGGSLIGHGHERYSAFLAALGLLILLCNLIGLVPGFVSPTATPTVPLGCAIATFGYYNWQGIRKQGLWHYAKHFAGPMPALAIIMVPIELVSHLARVLSLTVRLFANMFAGDMVTMVFFSLVPIGVPIAFLMLHIGVSFLQAYIFVLLTAVYLSGAVAEEH